MLEQLPIEFGGARLLLLGDRALYWPQERLLVIADLHLGKGATFRAHGIAIPGGGTTHDLNRLDRLLLETSAQGLLILGDVLHGGQPQASWRDAWSAFRQRWHALEMTAIIGNHDRELAMLPLGLGLLQNSWRRQGIDFRHDASNAAGPTIGGHLHPVTKIAGEARRQPVFWVNTRRIVLPAFSAFTGGYLVRAVRGDDLYACNGEQLLQVFPRQGRSGGRSDGNSDAVAH